MLGGTYTAVNLKATFQRILMDYLPLGLDSKMCGSLCFNVINLNCNSLHLTQLTDM